MLSGMKATMNHIAIITTKTQSLIGIILYKIIQELGVIMPKLLQVVETVQLDTLIPILEIDLKIGLAGPQE